MAQYGTLGGAEQPEPGWSSGSYSCGVFSCVVCGLVHSAGGSREHCLRAQTWAGVCLLCLTSPSTPVRPDAIPLNSLADVLRLIPGTADLVLCRAPGWSPMWDQIVCTSFSFPKSLLWH